MDSFDATPRRIAKHNELRDHRNITDLTMDPQQLDDLAELTRGTYLRAGVRKRIAFVAPDGPGRAFALALSEALGTLTQLQVALFDTQETALQFLNDGHSNGDPSRRAG
ncbi:MAG: hypothetical protein CML68_03385 [Rhodobacteraceae bacterium]|nr:hypothetical protein [Paracoccaceae bacterium]